MSGEKRPAPELFGSTQLVKRQKSSSNLSRDALVKVSGNGALIQQGVSHLRKHHHLHSHQRRCPLAELKRRMKEQSGLMAWE
jgi:hypothetical protein